MDEVELHGGPLDGERIPVDPDDPEPGLPLLAEGCAFPGGRSWYEPDESGRWTWRADIPWEAM
ncbi:MULTISPECIES: hypothetical protein [Streptomyces]|uniref:Uncharacterized protein n=1 Tax=Streptomyces demainii TaxID=588122 RepID=A0ABT9LA71_9ACTN|nr:hypothetical protein [Streptomyces demainii]MDP9616431.1 hypothetical protein [Streptomyces demainii]